MEKKYIVKLDDNKLAYTAIIIDGVPYIKPLQLLPYTEPDMEKVREEAFKNGYDAACKDIDIKSKTNAAHRKGLEDAWECARKIVDLWRDIPNDELMKIFDVRGNWGESVLSLIMRCLPPSEAIEKIRQYEQEKEEIQVGDEVDAPFGKAIVVNIDSVAEKIWLVYADGHGGFEYFKDTPTKTGRHFPEIADVLRKMDGEE